MQELLPKGSWVGRLGTDKTEIEGQDGPNHSHGPRRIPHGSSNLTKWGNRSKFRNLVEL